MQRHAWQRCNVSGRFVCAERQIQRNKGWHRCVTRNENRMQGEGRGRGLPSMNGETSMVRRSDSKRRQKSLVRQPPSGHHETMLSFPDRQKVHRAQHHKFPPDTKLSSFLTTSWQNQATNSRGGTPPEFREGQATLSKLGFALLSLRVHDTSIAPAKQTPFSNHLHLAQNQSAVKAYHQPLHFKPAAVCVCTTRPFQLPAFVLLHACV